MNEAIQAGGEAYFRYRQIELVPQVAPAIARALAAAKLVTISSDGNGAADSATSNIMGVIQTVLAAQMVGRMDLGGDRASNGAPEGGGNGASNDGPNAPATGAQTALPSRGPNGIALGAGPLDGPVAPSRIPVSPRTR